MKLIKGCTAANNVTVRTIYLLNFEKERMVELIGCIILDRLVFNVFLTEDDSTLLYKTVAGSFIVLSQLQWMEKAFMSYIDSAYSAILCKLTPIRVCKCEVKSSPILETSVWELLVLLEVPSRTMEFQGRVVSSFPCRTSPPNLRQVR